VARPSTTIGLTGDTEDTLLEGAQLVFHVSCGGTEVAFLDASLRAPGHTLDGGAVAVDATLQEMAAHFVIPEVPDVATLFPEKHTAMLARLDELERVMNE